MVPKRKEYSNDLRSLAIRYSQNGDSQWKITTRTLLLLETVLDVINKYERSKYIVKLLGRGRKRPTTERTDRMIQRIMKKVR